ncbi:LIM and calponin homology domains-containing protein 1 isoform X3 [Syngnathus scovelli]|uniref:LIM and calponin homology domains-containing protein 1 isoform X3 n=1 Tax=Syngnathus scovelli TaxID=161590 RepID=UPI00211040B2|nr:LIM and calponin homology domains-containing protein 1 isoform X3 [Syngnathus scovelli]
MAIPGIEISKRTEIKVINHILAVTGRCFGDKNFRGGLENGILLCELLSSIKPGLVKKINRLPTPIAGLDNLSVFLRGCEELGLKGSQLFDPGDLQDTSTRPAAKRSDCGRKIKNVLITIYWLGRAANSCTFYNGPTLDLREFEGLLSQMRKEAEEAESPQRSIRDSGYIDCWDSERSDSLSPPRHCREDSFDSLDSFGSRSQQTPSPDVLVARGSSDGRGSDSESDGPPHRKTPDIHKDDMLARRTSVSEPRTAMPFNQYLPNKCNQGNYVPTPLRKKKNGGDKDDDERKSWSTATSPVGGERPLSVSHDPQSMSMIDMRGEVNNTTILPPHSHVRHELMRNQYNQMKEDDSHWQDDLARWKNRRRSISQDLIKKEEERKLMEQLMIGGECISQRRRSIKTYKEIVEDKERREEELRAAYRRAKTPEEAAYILQRYAQRFSISETVMERLQLPKVLDRSVSADPSFCGFPISLTPSPTTSEPWDADPDGPLKYLRQPFAPAPRFTSTVEAQIDEWPRDSPPQGPKIRSRSSELPSSPPLSPKPLPLLTPEPYFQPWPATPEPCPSKADGLLRVNGNMAADSATPESQGSESSPVFLPYSLPQTTAHHPSASATKGILASTNVEAALGDIQDKEVALCSTPPSRPTSLPVELQKPEESFERKSGRQSAVAPAEKKSQSASHLQTSAEAKQETIPSCESGLGTNSVTSLTSIDSHVGTNQKKEEVPSFGHQLPTTTTEGVENSTRFPLTSSNPNLRCEFFADKGEKDHYGNVSVPVSPQTRRADRWSWDPAEERKRQERWQQEQARLLQEKYQREQKKLKEEWEKAQREVVREERRYHEEERLILEETVTALIPQSSATSVSECQDTIVRSLADWERKQEQLERHSLESGEVECRPRENDKTSDISTADNSVRTAKSSVSQTSCVKNGQKLHQMAAKTSAPVKKLQDGDASKPARPAGERRNAPATINAGRSPPKPPPPCVDTPPNRSVSGKKLCSSCGQPLGKGAAMIIETLSLYFHIDCFKCGVCKGQLGDMSTGTDVRIRSGLLNCHQCYIRSRSAGQPTTL